MFASMIFFVISLFLPFVFACFLLYSSSKYYRTTWLVISPFCFLIALTLISNRRSLSPYLFNSESPQTVFLEIESWLQSFYLSDISVIVYVILFCFVYSSMCFFAFGRNVDVPNL